MIFRLLRKGILLCWLPCSIRLLHEIWMQSWTLDQIPYLLILFFIILLSVVLFVWGFFNILSGKKDGSLTDFSFRSLFIWYPNLDKVIYVMGLTSHTTYFSLCLQRNVALFFFFFSFPFFVLYRRLLMLAAVERQILGNMSLYPPWRL